MSTHKTLSNTTPIPSTRRLARAGCIAILLTICRATAADVTSTWASAVSRFWNVNGNWTNAPANGGFPNNGNLGIATYDAVINAFGPAYTVTANSAITVEHLTLSSVRATLGISGGVFTANTGMTLTSGSLVLNGGTISATTITAAPGTLNIGANSNNQLSGVTVNGDLNLAAFGGVTRINGGTSFSTAHLANSSTSLAYGTGQTLTGTILMEGTASVLRTVEMTSTGTFTVGSTGIIRTNAGFGGDGNIGANSYFSGAMTLANQGLISSQVSGRTITISGPSMSNTGTLEATGGGILTIGSGTWTNTGTVRSLLGSTATLNGDWSNLGGTITADATSTLNFGGSFSTPKLGTLNLSAGSAVTVSGAWDNSGHSFTLNAATGSWTLKGGTIAGGTIGFAGGQNLNFAANANTNQLNGVTVNGDLNLNASRTVTRITGGTTFNTAHLASDDTSLAFGTGQTLTGTVLMEGTGSGLRSVDMFVGGTFTVGPTGVIRTNAGFRGDSRIGGGGFFGGAMTLFNQGIVSSQTNGGSILIAGPSMSNTGIIEATNGGILLIASGTWSNTGTLRSLLASTATLNGSWSNLGGTIDADPTSTLNFGGNFATPNLGTLNLAPGTTVNIVGAWDNSGQSFTFNPTAGSWTLKGGTIAGGTIGFTGGQNLIIASNNTNNQLSGVTINGDLNLTATNAVTRITDGTTFHTAHLANNNTSLGYGPGQTLAGTILVEGTASGLRHVGAVGTGTFTVGSTGVIRTDTGLGGDGNIGSSPFYFGAMTLINQGLVSSQVSGRTIVINPASFTNSGTLEATNGGIVHVPNGYTQTAGTTRVANGSTISVDAGNTIAIDGGRLEGAGIIAANVSNAGTIAPGLSAGALTISGDLTLRPTSVLQIELGGRTSATQYDLLTEGGTVPLSLAGALDVSFISGFQNSVLPTDVFTFLQSNQSIGGTFANLSGGRVATSDGTGSFAVTVMGNSVQLGSFAPVPEPSTAALLALGSLLCGARRRRRAHLSHSCSRNPNRSSED